MSAFVVPKGIDESKLQVYSARKMLERSTDELVKMLNGNFRLQFEDGVTIVTNRICTLYSSYAWDILRAYPNVAITSRFHVNSVLGNKLLNSGTCEELTSRIVFDGVIDSCDAQGVPFDKDLLARLYYEKTTELYNFSVQHLMPHMAGLDIMSYRELYDQPDIWKLVNEAEKTEESLGNLNRMLPKLVTENPLLDDNDLSIAAKAGLVRMNQFVQCIGHRAFTTDMNQQVLAEPAMGNCAMGYADFYSFFIDTKTAAKALHFSGELLRKTEYKSRKLQILDMAIETIYQYDCGSDKYMHWKMQAEQKDAEGKVIRKADARYFFGKYFLDEDLGVEREFRKEDENKYLGKILKFRSTLGGCKVPDPHGICYKCWNSIGRLLPDHTNVGHCASAALMQILSQSILSVKHIDSSSSSAVIELTDFMQRYFKPSKDGKSYMFLPSLAGTPKRMFIPENQVDNIANINQTDDLLGFAGSLDHLTAISEVGLEIEDKNSVGTFSVVFEIDNRKAFFTVDALEYFKKKGWDKTEDGNYVFDFTDWPSDKPFLSLPQRHYSMVDHADEITRLIQGRSDDQDSRKQDGMPIEYFAKLFELVNSRMDVPAAVLEIIILGASIRNGMVGDFRPPKYGTTSQMGLTNTTVPGRDVGPTIGFEHHSKRVLSSENFNPAYKSDHLFDMVIMPEEAVRDRRKHGLR